MVGIKTIGVVGGGQMGSGIAQLAVVHGFDAWLVDTDSEALVRAKNSIYSSIQRFVSKGQLSQARIFLKLLLFERIIRGLVLVYSVISSVASSLNYVGNY